MMKKAIHAVFGSAILIVGFACAAPARADLVGTTITGSVVYHGSSPNCFAPGSGCLGGSIPAGDENATGNTVLISATQVEFGFTDSDNADSANFTGIGFTISDDVLVNAASFEMTFTDTAFLGGTVMKQLDSFTNGGLTYSLSGNLLTIDWKGTTTSDGPLSAIFSFTPAANVTPEPSSLLLLATGVLGAVRVAKRKLAA